MTEIETADVNEKLVERILTGDKDAYEEIVQKYRDIVFAAVYAIVKNHHTAEDITQETFFDGYLKINTLLDARKIGAWLIKIAKNKSYNYLNRSDEFQHETELSEYIADTYIGEEESTPESSFIHEYERYIVSQTLKNLPDTHRNTTVMFYFGKYSRKKISEVLNIPEATVKRRLHDARGKLKKEFEKMSAYGESYVMPDDFEKNIVRSLNNISMINIYKPNEEKKVVEVKFGDITDFSLARIEMIAPTESEVNDIARAVNIDKNMLNAVLDGEPINNGAVHAVQFVTDTKDEEKVGMILTGNATTIIVSQGETAEDSVIKQSIRAIYELLSVAGYINLDCADVTRTIDDGRYAYTGIGHGKGTEKGETAAKEALSSPQLKKILPKSKGLIVSVVAAPNIGLDDVDAAMTIVQQATSANANTLFGVSFNDSLDDEMKVIVMAMDSEEPVYEI